MARDFNGSTDDIDCGSPTVLDDLTSLTFSCHIILDVHEAARIVVKSDGSTNGWMVRLIPDGNIHFDIFHSTTNVARRSSGPPWSTGIWYHLMITSDMSTTAANTHIYIDGTEVSYGTTINGSGSYQSDAGQNLILGNDTTGNAAINGRMANVKLFQEDMTSDTNKLQYGRMYSNANIVGWWELLGLDSPEPDWSGNANPGTLTGTAAADHPQIGLMTQLRSFYEEEPAAPAGPPHMIGSNSGPTLGWMEA